MQELLQLILYNEKVWCHMLSSTERLVKALQEQNDPQLDSMIEKAKNGMYHDLKSNLEFPTIQLVKDLLLVNHKQLAQRVINGEFEADAEEFREWFQSDEVKIMLVDWAISQCRDT